MQSVVSTVPARVTRSASAASLAEISGLKPSEGALVPPVDVLESILSLPLPDLKEHLESATSEELRNLRAYMGLGKAGTKEANKLLICKQVEKRRSK